jgi:hypothetical protein
MPTGTATNVIRGKASVYFGAASATAFATDTFTNIGYTVDGGYKLSISRDGADIEVDQSDWPIDMDIIKQDLKVSFTFAEVTLANLALALGITGATNSVTLVQDSLAFKALALLAPCPPVGTNTTNGTRTILLNNVKPDGEITIAAGEKGKAQNIPAAFRYFNRITNLPTATDA